VQYFLGCDKSGQPYAQLIAVPCCEDGRGQLFPYEFKNQPFVPKRIFVVRSVPVNTVRGLHSHKKQRQVIICLSGAIEIELRISGNSASLILDSPEVGLLIEPGVWASQKFLKENTIQLAMASGPYDPADYMIES